MALDLTPFGFTPTESLVYATLLRLGPSTGYAIARGARLARANAYGALEGLVSRGAATRTPPPERSEERRVGKECRARRGPEQCKKKRTGEGERAQADR